MANKREFGFNEQKEVGDIGEKLFLEYYPECTKGDGIIADFYLRGEKVELKTDTWNMEETPNFFMEFQSDMKRGTPGGVFRSAEEGTKYYVYFFIVNKVFYWFDVVTLVNFLSTYIIGKKYKTVKNKAWITSGYTVPRDALEHLAIQVDNFSENNPF